VMKDTPLKRFEASMAESMPSRMDGVRVASCWVVNSHCRCCDVRIGFEGEGRG
jgi:hypothetical protein